jgi:uncharacterized membrane protein YuzA (DUF378 family)
MKIKSLGYSLIALGAINFLISWINADMISPLFGEFSELSPWIFITVGSIVWGLSENPSGADDSRKP